MGDTVEVPDIYTIARGLQSEVYALRKAIRQHVDDETAGEIIRQARDDRNATPKE